MFSGLPDYKVDQAVGEITPRTHYKSTCSNNPASPWGDQKRRNFAKFLLVSFSTKSYFSHVTLPCDIVVLVFMHYLFHKLQISESKDPEREEWDSKMKQNYSWPWITRVWTVYMQMFFPIINTTVLYNWLIPLCWRVGAPNLPRSVKDLDL